MFWLRLYHRVHSLALGSWKLFSLVTLWVLRLWGCLEAGLPHRHEWGMEVCGPQTPFQDRLRSGILAGLGVPALCPEDGPQRMCR